MHDLALPKADDRVATDGPAAPAWFHRSRWPRPSPKAPRLPTWSRSRRVSPSHSRLAFPRIRSIVVPRVSCPPPESTVSPEHPRSYHNGEEPVASPDYDPGPVESDADRTVGGPSSDHDLWPWLVIDPCESVSDGGPNPPVATPATRQPPRIPRYLPERHVFSRGGS